jgi:hypothetical protein
VIITGTNFTGATGVSFGGTSAASFTVLSPTEISAIPNFGSPGYVSVTTWGGTATLPGFYYVVSPPVITSFSPTSGSVDSAIYISGTNLTTVNQVSFGGTRAASFTILSPTSILAYVGTGSSGSISVRNDTGTASLGGFVYVPAAIAPTVTSFTPTSAATDSTVIITGTNFTGVTSVSFGGAPAFSFTILSPTRISAVVGYGLSGNVSVQNAEGAGALGGFVCTTPPVPPTITSFSPTSAATNSLVTITGTNFLEVSGVSFGGIPASSFTILSSTAISAVVGNGASGEVSMRNDTGTAVLGGFVYIPAAGVPSITSFSPSTAYTDSVVTITGFNFTGATSVLFGGTPAASFTVASPTEIQAVVGSGSSGAVTVVTPGPGDTALMNWFNFSPPPPPSFAVLQFTGVLANDQAQLQWQVQGEGAVSSYVIAHSTDSVNFTTIDTQQPHDSIFGVSQYTFTDPAIAAGKNFYRLGVLDTPYTNQIGGTAVLTVEINYNKGANSTVTFPNPATGQTPVSVPLSTQTAVLELIDLKGNVMATETLAPGTTQTQVNFSGVPPGIYMLSWRDGSRIQTKRVMVGGN